MRPHRLTMKAFISYADEVVVDFDALGNEVYAIVGDTGSGKTAIFDGLMFALYGVCSGEGRTDTDYEQIHCDLCKREDGFKEPMEVVLEFSSGDDRYKVTRKISWGATNKAAKMDFASSLNKFDEESGKYKSSDSSTYKFDNNSNKVTQRIKEIIGLDANQFKNIVMIAQGEFARFLNSDADTRKVILGKVYNNQEHSDLQARIHHAMTRLGKDDEALRVLANGKLSEIAVPAYCDLSEEDYKKFNIDHPGLLSVIDVIIAKMDERNKTLETETKALNDAITEKDRVITAAKETNSLFDALDKDKKSFGTLENDKSNIDALRVRLTNVDAASKVLPYEKTSADAVKSLNDVIGRKKKLDSEYAEKDEEHKRLDADAKRIAENNDVEIRKLTEEISTISAVMPFYDELETSRKELDTANREFEKNGKQAEKLAKELETLKKKNDEYKKTLTALEDAGDPAVAAAERELGLVREKQTGLDEFDKSVNDYLKLEKDLSNAKQKWEEDSKAAKNAGADYLKLNSLFIDGYAAVLAGDMVSKLEIEEEVECPVCGVKHTKADIDSFAHSRSESKDVPSRTDVESALARRNELEAEEKESYQALQQKEGRCKGAKSSILSISKKLIGTESWDDIIAGDLLDKCKAECSEAYDKAEKAFAKAVDERKQKTEISNKQHDLEQIIGKKEKEVTEADRLKTEAEKKVKVCEAKVIEQKKPLAGFPETKTEAEKKKSAADEKAKTLQSEIDSAAKKEQECANLLSELQGKIKSTEEEQKNCEAKAEEAKGQYKANLAKNGFTEEKVYKEVLVQDGVALTIDNIEGWIKSHTKKVTDYDSKVKELKAGIAALVKQTEGKERIDIKAINEEIRDLRGQLEPKSKEFEKNTYDLKRYKDIEDELKGILDMRRKYLLASQKLKNMDEEANSKYGEKFDSYILRDFFKSILVSADERLAVMTNNRFSLEFDDEEKKGLGIKVLDTKTETCRKTGNFSGGQSFEASLALALGVADTVQNEENKAIQIESLFIDEGFGTQDSNKFDSVMKVLDDLSKGKRQVGIISHMAAFEEKEIKKVRVEEGTRGSIIKMETYK